MARKKGNSASSTSFEEQLRQLDEQNARITADRFGKSKKAFSNMIERQQEMLANFYKASSEAGRESIKADMEERQQKMKEQLDSMRKSYALYSQFMTKTEKKTFKQMIQTSQDGMDSINREMSKRFDTLDDDFEELTDSFSDKIGKVFNELRDLTVALNINDITDGIEESVDSYVKNLREADSLTGYYFSKGRFSDTVSSVDKSLEAYGRDETSEFIVSMIKDMGMKNLDEIATYAQTVASADIMGISRDDMGNIMWKDMEYGQNGKWMRSISNMAVTLGENEELYISTSNILNGIASNVEAVYGLAGKDSKKATNMVKSLAAIQALEENAQLDGVTTLSGIMTDWSNMSKAEFYEDDRAVNFASLLGMNIDDLYSSVRDPERLDDFLDSFQTQLNNMNEFQIHSFTEALGFEKDYQLFEIAGYDDLVPTLDLIQKEIESSFSESEASPELDLMKNAADSTIGTVDKFKKDVGSTAIVSFLSDILAELDLGFSDVIAVATTGFNLFSMFKGVKSGEGLFGKTFSKVSNWFKGAGKATKASNAASFTADDVAKAFGSTVDDVAETLGKSASYSIDDIAKGLGSSVDEVSDLLRASGFIDDAARVAGAADDVARAAGFAGKAAGVLGKAGKALGIAGVVIEGAVSTYEAVDAYKSGDSRKGASEIGEGAGSIAGGLGGAAAGAAAGAALGTVVPVIGNAIGAVVGGIIGGIAGGFGGGALGKEAGGAIHDAVSDFKSFSDDQLAQIQEYYDRVSEIYNEDGRKAAKNYTNEVVVPYLNSIGVSESITDKYKRDTGKNDFMLDFEKDKFLGYYENGISYVPYDGLAMIHAGEAVLTKEQASHARAQSDGGIPMEPGDVFVQSLKDVFVWSLEKSSLFGTVSTISDILDKFFDGTDKWRKKEDSKSKRNLQVFKSKLIGRRSSDGGGIFSGIASFFDDILPFADGGVVTSPTVGLVGEAGPEAVIPLEELSGGANAEKIWNFLIGQGASAAGAAGIMGNLQAESALEPTNLQNSYERSLGMTDSSYTTAVDNGSYTNFVHDSAGYGLAQWTFWSLKEAMLNSARASNASIGDLSFQLGYLVQSLKDNGLWSYFTTVGSILDASNKMLHSYERPADQSYSVEMTRAGYGQGFYDQFASYDVGTPWVKGDQVALIHDREMIVPESVNPLNSSTVSVPLDSGSSEDSSETVETLKWMVYRLEAKLDKLISVSSSQNRRTRISMNEDMDRAYSV